MLHKSKMSMALRPLSDTKIKELNQYISIEDSKKDVFMSNMKKRIQANGSEVKESFSLNRQDHKFMLDLIDQLYVTEEQGGGGKNPRIEAQIREAFGRDVFREGPSQQFSFLRMDANDTRIFSLRNKHLVIDTGLQSKFGEECKSVIGPFSVMDPGSRTLSGQLNLLQTGMTFNYREGACALLDMDGYVTSVEYQHLAGEKPYQFTVTFADGTQKKFQYSKTRVSTDSIVNNSKNYKRNELVHDMFTTPKFAVLRGKELEEITTYISTRPSLQEIDAFFEDLRFQLWWKEMGDTSFPVWIQSYMGTHGLRPDNTVIGSADWGVIYRSLVNKMACAFQTKTQTTYYPIVDGVYQSKLLEQGAQGKRGRDGEKTARSLKKMLLKDLLANNAHVLAILRKCKGIVSANPIFLLGSITEPNWYKYEGEYKQFRMDILRSFMLVLCNTMIQYVKPLIAAIEGELTPEAETQGDLVEFRLKVGNYRLRSPFVPFGRDEFTIPKYSFQFIPVKIGGSGDHMFTLSSIPTLYSDKYKRAELLEPSADQLMSCMKELYGAGPTLVPAAAEWEEDEEDEVEVLEEQQAEAENVEQQEEEEGEGPATKRQRQGGGGFTEEHMNLYRDILTKNRYLPNFLLFFVNTYVPEFFPMALAYELAMHPTEAVLDTYKPVFSHSVLSKTLSPFGKIVDGQVEYTDPGTRRSRSGSGSGSGSVSARARSASASAASKIDRNALVERACAILKGAQDPEKNILFALCKKKAPELLWCIGAMGVAATPIPEEGSAIHLRALGYYQQIYDEDVQLCILNRREKATPLDSIELIDPAPQEVTPGRGVSLERRQTLQQPFHAVYAKYPSATPAATSKKAKGFFQSTSARKMYPHRVESIGTLKKRAAQRRKAFLTRKQQRSLKP